MRLSGRGEQSSVAPELVVFVAEHRRVIEHHDPLQFTQLLGERQDLVDVFLIFRDEQHGAAVPHLIFDFGCGSGRIDAIDDGSERLCREIADRPFLAGVPHDGYTVALLKSEGCEGARRTRDQRRIVAPASFAVEAEMLGAKCNRVRCRPCAFAQQQRRGLATQHVAIERWPWDHAAPGERLAIEFLYPRWRRDSIDQ